MANATRMIGAAALLLAGCTSSSIPTIEPSATANQPPRLEKVTFHVTRMNERLKILGGDGPNKVKQALVGLNGVESVEDEWERELESKEDLDVLFVTYDPQRVTVDKMRETIAEQAFEVKE